MAEISFGTGCVRSARMGDEIGGHNVAGHIHSTAEIVSLEETPNNLRMVFQVTDLIHLHLLMPDFPSSLSPLLAVLHACMTATDPHYYTSSECWLCS